MVKPDQTILLPDGRRLGYAESGDPGGKPMFLFHGQPGNRLLRHPDDGLTASLGVRLISVDRPGYGLSDFQPGRKILNWPNDVVALADALGYEQFAVAGFSAGGPYAAACAYKIPTRLTKVALISSAPPMHLREIRLKMPTFIRFNDLLNRFPPFLYGSMQLSWRYFRRNPQSFIQLGLQRSSPADVAVFNKPEMASLVLAMWEENLRIPSQGYAYDAQLLLGDWGFRLQDISMRVYYWHGEADANSLPTWGHVIASSLPDCQAVFWPGEGHFGWVNHWTEILEELSDDSNS
jgi:pimeloyl-ACP methyl ester carboxylesterase